MQSMLFYASPFTFIDLQQFYQFLELFIPVLFNTTDDNLILLTFAVHVVSQSHKKV